MTTVKKGAVWKLAQILGVKPDELLVCRDLIDSGDAYYQWQTPKLSGGVREITSPVEELKKVQRRVLQRILYHIQVSMIATGFVRGKDIFTNADMHRGARTILNMDMKSAFPSVRTIRVERAFQRSIPRILRTDFGEAITSEEIDDIMHMLVKLCMHEDCLPQGTPTSPMLLNTVCLHLDRQLIQLAMEHDLTISRYADDLSFSTPEDDIPGAVRQEIRTTIARADWVLNQRKTKLQRRATGSALEVTGLTLGQNGGLAVPVKRRESYVEYLQYLLDKDELSDAERQRAVGIIVYSSRVYRRGLPTKLGRTWGRLKEKHGFQTAPAPKYSAGTINVYAPDLSEHEKGLINE